MWWLRREGRVVWQANLVSSKNWTHTITRLTKCGNTEFQAKTKRVRTARPGMDDV